MTEFKVRSITAEGSVKEENVNAEKQLENY